MVDPEADRRTGATSTDARLRLAIFGGVLRDESSVGFARTFGASLARHTAFTVCHSGFKGKHHSPPEHIDLPFTRATIEGMAEALSPEHLNARILTVLTSTRSRTLDHAFRMGTVLELGIHRDGDYLPAISMAQLVCVGGGSDGILDIFQKAMALRIPALPLPFFGGMGRNLFFAHSEQIKRGFALSDETFRSWCGTQLEHLSAERMSKLAAAVTQSLVGAIRQKSA